MTSIAKFAQMTIQDSPHDLIRDLERDSQTLDRIGNDFGRILDGRTLTIWSFSEELAMTGIGRVCMSPICGLLGLTRIDQVVPGESAVIGDPRENRGTILGDHISMVKFSTKDDPGYKKVLYSIEMMLEGLRKDSVITSKQGVLNSCIAHAFRNFNHG